ncbi:MAG: pyridoxamine 5'-phosphate oxidase [Gammaproteobacteria bacterium]|nr:pyridoxamine 5'-phosphate oxidase [Gammaproteobacteria bacterium]MBQ0840915.1 pyridoxamine 5'-phosphate oxidase [Gammaproteobacteria bacterium]
MTIEDTRREYDYGRLSRDSLLDNPFEQFQLWLDQACQSPIKDPTAMTIATVGADNKPWHRAVLLKGFDKRGFVFYTNLGSRKAHDIANNPHVSLHFPWFFLDRQVSIGGVVEKVSRSEVLKYFLSRPKDSQLAAWASKQSSRLTSRQALESQFMAMKEKFAHGDIPTPDFWGGFRVVPEEFQFWQGGENRLHDRYQYSLNENGQWGINQLAP